MSAVWVARAAVGLVLLGAVLGLSAPRYDGGWLLGLLLVVVGGAVWLWVLRSRAVSPARPVRRGPWRCGGVR